MKLCGMFPELKKLAHNAEQRNHHSFRHFVLKRKKKLAKFTFLAPTDVCIPLNYAFILLGVIKYRRRQYNLRVTSERTERLGVDF